MEKLQPIIKQRFWILLGVVVILSITGWWMATSTLLQAITTRKTTIDGAYNKIPKGAVPNENWTKELENLNKVQEKAINDARTLPWQKQQSKLLVWPDGVDLRNGYWGKFGTISREVIRNTYSDEVRKVWKMVNPLDPEEKDALGVVVYPFANMYEILRLQPWKTANVVADETIWEMKEDLWLLERLFQSVTTVNGGMEVTQNDASIHTIDRLELRGGGPKTPSVGGAGFGLPGGMLAAAAAAKAAAAGAAAAASGGGGLMGRGNPDDDGPGAGRFGAGGGMVQANYQKTEADFDPTEEFGNDGGMGGGGGAAVALGGPSLGGPSSMGQPRERYVNKEDNLPYKTRGFYLSVKMDHRKIPELIAELTANENTILPIEILRVQMTRLQEDEVDKVPESRGGRPGRGLAAGGAPLGGGPGGGISGMNRMMRANLDDDDGRGRGRMGMGGMNSGGASGGRVPTTSFGTANIDRLDAERASAIASAEATFKKVTADPNMAQVAIAGVFLLYKKVEEPAATDSAAPGAKPAAADNASTPASASPTADATAETPASTEPDDTPASDTPARDTSTSETPAEPMTEGDAPNESAAPGETANGTDAPADSKESPEKAETDEDEPKSQN